MSSRKLLLILVAFLGVLNYCSAQGTKPDPLQEIRTKAERGDPLAQYSLGVMYDSGLAVPQDYAEPVIIDSANNSDSR